LPLNNQRYAKAGNDYEDEGQAEEEAERNLPPGAHAGTPDYRDRENDEEYVGNDIRYSHGEQMGVALTTFGSRIRNDLPVVADRLALGESRNEDGDKGEHKKRTDTTQTMLIALFPESLRHALEELGDSELRSPNKQGIKDPRCDDQLGSNLAVVDFDWVYQPLRVHVVCTIYEDDVDAAHSCQ
jgi:hypothetical protein